MAVYPQGPVHGFDNVSYCSIITPKAKKEAIAYFKSKQTLPPFGFADQNRG